MRVANLQILHLCFHLKEHESQLQHHTTPLVKEKWKAVYSDRIGICTA
jgi:hypothetical protein